MGTSHTCLSHRAVSIPVRAPPRYTSITATSGGLLIANSLASFSFDATLQTSNSCIEASKSNAIRNSSSTISARREDRSCAIGHLDFWRAKLHQRARALLVPAAARFSQTRTREVVVSGTWAAIGWTTLSLGHQSAPKKLSRSVIGA